jgi:hypothetical protein
MRYWLALAAASVVGPYFALFGFDMLRGGLLGSGFPSLSAALQPMILFIVMVFAIPIAAALAALDSLVVRALSGRFDRLLFVLIIVAAGLAAAAAFVFLSTPARMRAENLAVFGRLGGTVALLWAVLRPFPKEAAA